MMRPFKHLIAAAALALAAGIVASPPPANAQQMILCPSSRESNSASRQVSLPTLSKTYPADSSGCIVVSGAADVAILQAAGYAQEAPYRTLFATTGVLAGTTDFVVGIIPPGAFVQTIIIQNSTANAVTGGISFGSTANGTDIVAATVCAANCVANSTIVKAAFSATAATTLHAAAVTAWNNANVTITVVYGFF